MVAQKIPNSQTTRNSWQACTPAQLFLALVICLLPLSASAQWKVNQRTISPSGTKGLVAHTENDAGYALEFYKDVDAAIRIRLNLPTSLSSLYAGSCPTYIIDQGKPDNRSYDASPCSGTAHRPEFITGHIENQTVKSDLLLQIMNGNSISFRFRLEQGDYRETSFSLAGSKRSMTTAIGKDIRVQGR
jgi:hypothetical protein